MLKEQLLKLEERNVKELLENTTDPKEKMEILSLRPHYQSAVAKLADASGAKNMVQYVTTIRTMGDAVMTMYWLELSQAQTAEEYQVIMQTKGWEMLGVEMTEDEALALRIIGTPMSLHIHKLLTAKQVQLFG